MGKWWTGACIWSEDVHTCGFQVVGLMWSWGLCVQFAGCCFTGSVLWHVWCGWLHTSWKRGFGSFGHCSGISLPAWWRHWMWNCLKGSNMLSCWRGLSRVIDSANVLYSCWMCKICCPTYLAQSAWTAQHYNKEDCSWTAHQVAQHYNKEDCSWTAHQVA